MEILAVTSCRADWGLLSPLLAALRDDKRFRLRLAVTGQHLSADSSSLDAIRDQKFTIDHEIDMELADEDHAAAISSAMGRAIGGMGQVLASARPDLMLVLGDRYEIQAVVSAALIARVPVAHLCGGDVTEGAMDDALRHSISKMSSLHFVTHEAAAQRLRQLGEAPERIFNVGSTGLDTIRMTKPLEREAFFNAVNLSPQKMSFLITFHPVTLSQDTLGQCVAILDALSEFENAGLIFTGANADPEGASVDRLLKEYVNSRPNAVFHSSLGSKRFFSALSHVDVMVGNSSSGLYEAPSFSVPTVNIGDRQTGRPRARSVIDCPAAKDAIVAAIQSALALDCTETRNPFGDGHSSRRIVSLLAELTSTSNLIRKKFVDIQSWL